MPVAMSTVFLPASTVDPTNTKAGPYFSSIVLTYVIALVSVVLRIIARKKGGIKFWWDDWLIFVAMVCTAAM